MIDRCRPSGLAMAVLEAKDLVIRTKRIEEGGRGTFLEISFEGVHTHHWPAGCDVAAFVEGEIRAAVPSACLFDFLHYEYGFGNEIVGLFFYPLNARIPVAIVVQSGPEWSRPDVLSLRGFITALKLDKLPDCGLFEDAESGYAFLRDRVDRRADPLSPG